MLNRKIQIKLERGDYPTQLNTNGIKTINSISIIDNGEGFNTINYSSFGTPHSFVNKQYGCKGIGRFTWLAAYEKVHISSNYKESDKWMYREFLFDSIKEVEEIIEAKESNIHENKTVIVLKNCYNTIIKDRTAQSLEQIEQEIMKHCLIYIYGY